MMNVFSSRRHGYEVAKTGPVLITRTVTPLMKTLLSTEILKASPGHFLARYASKLQYGLAILT
jgi:hypothetical protein